MNDNKPFTSDHSFIPSDRLSLVRKQKDRIYFKNLSMHELNLSKFTHLKDAILAAIKLTNSNLINQQKRAEKYSRKGVATMISQADVIGLFKGNSLRIFKQIFSSPIINRIKRSASFLVQLDKVHPVIVDVRIVWLDNIEWLSADMKSAQRQIDDMFANITSVELAEQAYNALKEYKDVNLESIPNEKPNLTLEEITFDSIKNIKFIS